MAKPGSIGWVDITVADAHQLKQSYAKVVGWRSEPVAMDSYDDFCMLPASGAEPVAGICHARGVNADLPPGWIVYIIVEDLDRSIEPCKELGGTIMAGPKKTGTTSRYCVIRDPPAPWRLFIRNKSRMLIFTARS